MNTKCRASGSLSLICLPRFPPSPPPPPLNYARPMNAPGLKQDPARSRGGKERAERAGKTQGYYRSGWLMLAASSRACADSEVLLWAAGSWLAGGKKLLGRHESAAIAQPAAMTAFIPARLIISYCMNPRWHYRDSTVDTRVVTRFCYTHWSTYSDKLLMFCHRHFVHQTPRTPPSRFNTWHTTFSPPPRIAAA